MQSFALHVATVHVGVPASASSGAAAHRPLMQAIPELWQSMHAWAPAPHESADWPPRQSLPTQQPLQVDGAQGGAVAASAVAS